LVIKGDYFPEGFRNKQKIIITKNSPMQLAKNKNSQMQLAKNKE
jgi:hypothetical protein